jgi:hypothetical protein
VPAPHPVVATPSLQAISKILNLPAPLNVPNVWSDDLPVPPTSPVVEAVERLERPRGKFPVESVESADTNLSKINSSRSIKRKAKDRVESKDSIDSEAYHSDQERYFYFIHCLDDSLCKFTQSYLGLVK